MYETPDKPVPKHNSSTADGHINVPTISLPKGGGAIRGISEKFATNPVTGTGSMTIPIYTSPGRSGFGPQLSLSYDSGSGNGPFGFGWSLSLPTIKRRTDRGLPLYRDYEESDTYLLSGYEDLVPLLLPDGSRFKDTTSAPGFTIHRYHPRIEGIFARIERWTENASGAVHWRSFTRDNITTLYGTEDSSRITDPEDPTHVFSWLICRSYDDKGNVVAYEYVGEDASAVDSVQSNERNRVRTANRYIKRIFYGNQTSRLIDPDLTDPRWMFEVVFDYDEGHYAALPLDPTLIADEQHRYVQVSESSTHAWTRRPDPFSDYRSTFEVRTYRRCLRVLMFHHFDELGSEPCLVRSTYFDYGDLDYSVPVPISAELGYQGSTRFASFIVSVTQSGFLRDVTRPVVEHGGARFVTYLKKSLPPVEMEYSKGVIQDDVREVDAQSLENLPAGLDGSTYRWVDLDGEGVTGVLTEQANGWFYKPNLGGASFGPLEAVVTKPSLANLSTGRQQLLDLAGDGQLDLVAFGGETPGFYERTHRDGWKPFRPFQNLPNVPWEESNLRFVDLDGDGRADMLVTEHEIFTWYPSLAEEGFGPAQSVQQPFDEERGPRLVLADGTESIYLADMSGDGLTDFVRIRNGEVCYWPNLGYGRFGAKVTMDDAPWFDHPDSFEEKRIRLADVDGSGTTDILYLGRNEIRIYFNQSGNRLSAPRPIHAFAQWDDLSTIMAVDLLGNGTACLVWSSPRPHDTRSPMRYIDLMDGRKPHLLVRYANNLGAETIIEYAPSTKFYLADKLAGVPWVTKIPFPVHVVERVSTWDRISGNLFVTHYNYHHGYFDGIEREFRGFGKVEQLDTEELAALNADQHFPDPTNISPDSHVPPVLTRTWYHTGIFLGRGRVSRHFEEEYYREPGLTDAQAEALLLDDTVLPIGLTIDEEREACRALKGTMLRQEIYALDGTAREVHPYLVTEQNLTIESLQALGTNRHAVFYTHARETLSYHYERDPSDPRTTHALTLAVDAFGNVLRSASIAYERRQPDPTLDPRDQAKQSTLLITYVESDFTNEIDLSDDYRAPRVAESRTFELTGLALPAGQIRFSFDQVSAAGTGATAIEYEQAPTPGLLQKRTIERTRTLYRRNSLAGSLPLGTLESLAIPFETYKLAFTPGLLTGIFGARVTPAMMSDDGRYVHSQGDVNWWMPAGRVFYSPDSADTDAQEFVYAHAHFFLPHRYRDPFYTDLVSTETFITYDQHDLLILETRDPLGNRTTAGERDLDPTLPLVRQGNDYRVLQPALRMDPNRNRSAVLFDALGMVAASALMGKPEDLPQQGDLIDNVTTDLTEAVISAHMQDPFTDAQSLLGNASLRLVYDLTAYQRTQGQPSPQPPVVCTLARETHMSDPVPVGGLQIQQSFSYSDGFAREIQKKVQAETGPVPRRDANGKILVGLDGQPLMTPNDVAPRWTGSGWAIYNNKANPVRKFEPFFTDTHQFEFDVRIGVSPVLMYDPVERAVSTLHPDHTWEKTVPQPWRQEAWDVNDTVLIADPTADPDIGDYFARLPNTDYLPTWQAQRAGGAFGVWEQDAAGKAIVHAGTPTVTHMDPMGRTILSVSHNRYKYSNSLPADPPIEEFLETRFVIDIQGNQREVRDPQDRLVMRYEYDMLGNRIHQASMEAGERWTLNDAAGKPIYAWDSRNHRTRTTYDPLRRPTALWLQEGIGPPTLVGHTVYGEARLNPETNNLRGRPVELYDQAGVVTTDDYDFKGNLLSSQRQLAVEYHTTLDWSAAVPLENDTYTTATRYDALNRVVSTTTPDNSVIRPTYNEANLLESLDANLRGVQQNGQPIWTAFITDVDYDAKGRRTRVIYGNGARTAYAYDPLTFRLASLRTRRDPVAFPGDCPQPPPTGWPGCQVQSLSYTYDPSGNVTHIRDDAQQTIYFRNQRVEPSADYTYDAVYRLIEATGREHLGQMGGSPIPHSYNDKARMGILLSANDGNAMGTYLERYLYDTAGNLTSMVHRGSGPVNPGWTRTFVYDEDSFLEPLKKSNRLTRTAVGGTPEVYSVAGDGYDAHGNMLKMPHLEEMQWDFRDLLQMTQRQAVNGADDEGIARQGERTYYTYDSNGQRVRKVTERAGGQFKEERIYLDGFEIYRRAGVNGLVRETLHVMDDQQRVALVETRTDGVAPEQLIRYQFGNHLGTSLLELDDQARIISYEEYTPYGSTSLQAVRSQTETPKRYRYTGKERDEETGFTYHGARYCAPWLARWTSCDPAGLVDGLNVYAYVSENPIKLRDPGGTDGDDDQKHEPVGGYPIGRGGFSFGTPHLEINPANFWYSSITQGSGVMPAGTLDVEAAGSATYSSLSGLGQPATSNYGLQNAQLALRYAVGQDTGADIGITGGGSYTVATQPTGPGTTATRGGFGAITGHYGWRSDAEQLPPGLRFLGDLRPALALYGSVGLSSQRTDGSSAITAPTLAFTGVVGLEQKDKKPESFDLSKPPESPYALSLSAIVLNPVLTYTGAGQLTQGPTLTNLVTVGGNAGVQVGVGKQFSLLFEGGAVYEHGSPAAGSDQGASAVRYTGGVVGTFSYLERGTVVQTSSIAVGIWGFHESGAVTGTARPNSPTGAFSTTGVLFGVTLGYRRPVAE